MRRARPAGGILAAACLLFSAGSLLAGGPNVVLGNGKVLRWDPANPATFPVRFTIDQGPLGVTVDNAQGAALVRKAFQAWQDVTSATIEFQDLGFLPMDLTADNYKAFFEGQERPENPVVFDTDGRITEDIFGAGSKTNVLGFAGVRQLDSQGFRSAWAVLNGFNAAVPNFLQVVTHEMGHLIGLDHSQANGNLAFNGTDTDNQFVPLMFPFSLPAGPEKPVRDDIAWISWIYPESDFAATTGTIEGTVRRATGSPMSGANVVAVKVTRDADGNLVESMEDAVSAVSDFLATGDGSFQLPGLPPGDYVLFIEPLNPLFTEGSGVGPFDIRFTGFPKDYYNGESESGDPAVDDPTQKTVITVVAGQMVSGIQMVTNEEPGTLDNLSDDASVSFDFPDGFSFPFFGKVYTSVFVNSDGNLSFGQGDVLINARDTARFLGGPPRIAPLFTDLNPEVGGTVMAQTSATQVRFTWQDVPEFSDAGIRPGNTFSVTLFSSGDILFSYTTVDVMPDPDGTQAVVGITPGGETGTAAQDLSTVQGALQIGQSSLFEAFLGSSFDLTGQEILFQASSARLLFPLNQGDDSNFTGFAVTNLSPAAVNLLAEARRSGGDLEAFPANPGSRTIAPGGQLAELGSELFQVDPVVPRSGWVRMTLGSSQVASFFQFGNGLSGPQTKLDGGVASSEPSTVLYFTRLLDGPGTFPSFASGGEQDAETFLAISNPNAQMVTVGFELFSAAGAMLAQASRDLAPFGSLFEGVRALFGLSDPVGEGYVRVQSSGAGVVGFSLIELSDTVLGLNAAVDTSSQVLYSAQLANGSQGGSGFFTSLKLVNTSDQPRTVTVSAFSDDGSPLGSPQSIPLAAGASSQSSVHDLFGLGSPAAAPIVAGSIRVDSDGPGLVGDVIFGDPGDAGTPGKVDFAAALPLAPRTFTSAVFSQVANGSLGPGAALDLFTGIALFNPGLLPAQVRIQVMDRDGMKVGEKTLPLEPGRRISDLIENLIPGTATLLRGYILVDSDQPLVAQQLFGNATLDYLSAVPPKILQ